MVLNYQVYQILKLKGDLRMSAKVKLISLISAFMLVLGIIVIGVLAVSQQTLRMSGSVNFNVDDKSLYVKQVRIKQDNGSEPEPVIGFLPGYINGDFVMNIGDFSGDDANTIGSFALYFDIINTTTYDWFVSDVSLSSTLQSQNVSVTYSGDIDAGSSTEITDTTPLSGTIILTISSPNATSIDLSGITVTLEAILPTPATSFEFSVEDSDHTASITKFVGSETEVLIPSTVENKGITYTVTSIGSSAFQGCSSLSSITIPSSVTSINMEAFGRCYALAEVYNYSPSITVKLGETSSSNNGYLGQYAKVVYNASDLSSGKPETRIKDYNGVRYYDDGLNTVVALHPVSRDVITVSLDSRTTEIQTYAFYGCDSLTSVDFGANSQLTSIGNYAFQDCTSLTSITIPDGVTSIGGDAFYSCDNLASITIGESVTSIGLGAFYYCNRLKDVTIKSDDIYLALASQSACGRLINYITSTGETVKVLKSVVDSVDPNFTVNTYLNGSRFTRSVSEDGLYYVYTKN